VSEFESASVLISFETRIVGRYADRCGLLIAEHRSGVHATQQFACLLSIGEFHNFPMGEWHIVLNVQFSVMLAQKWRSQKIPACECERGSVTALHTVDLSECRSTGQQLAGALRAMPQSRQSFAILEAAAVLSAPVSVLHF
jgi:hypothetical protein